jgi:hypothetical protein
VHRGERGLVMRYECRACGAAEWRGLFPEPTRNLRYAVIHGVGIGVCGVATRILFDQLGYATTGWANGLAGLGVCSVLLLVYYGIAITVEAGVMERRPCRACGHRGLHMVIGGRPEQTTVSPDRWDGSTFERWGRRWECFRGTSPEVGGWFLELWDITADRGGVLVLLAEWPDGGSLRVNQYQEVEPEIVAWFHAQAREAIAPIPSAGAG